MIGKLPSKSSCAQSDIRRLLASLKREKWDRTPNFEIWLGPRSIARILQRNHYDLSFWTMPPNEAVTLVNAIGQDAIVCSLSPKLPPRGSILAPGDLADFLNKGIDRSAMRTKLQTYLDATAGTKTGVVVQIGGPLTQTYMSCGPIPIQSFMLMLYDQPELIDQCMGLYTGWTLQIIEAIKDLPFALFYIGDDLCDNSGLMINPEFVESIWAPHYQQIIEAAHATGRPIICHCCGNQSPVIPYWLKWGVEACHPLQAGANDIYDFKKKYGNRLVPVGNISVGLLSSGTTEQVVLDVQKHLSALAQDGGYIVCSDHSIIDSVIPEHFLAMINTVHRDGIY